jgi:16S rRNA (uracil1498-N3)-methyltransferase
MSLLWVHVPELADGAPIALPPEEIRHVVARRLRLGDELVAFDGAGATATGRIERLAKRTVEIRLGSVERDPSPSMGFGLASAIPKGERLAVMLPMLIQLGLEVWQPLILAESVVRSLDPEGARLQRIGIEGCKVARRPWRMQILPPISLEALLDDRMGEGTLCYGDRLGTRGSLDPAPSWVVIGPEAGFTERERRALAEAGAQPRCFGPHNLRIETAAVAATVLGRQAG